MVFTRTSPLTGYITDSSGNVLRNTLVNIKEEQPSGLMVEVANVKTDGNGYFVTDPIRRGTYDIFESGVKLIRLTHAPSTNLEIPAYTPELDASPAPIITDPFDQELLESIFLQIEPAQRNVDDNGHIFDTIPLASTGFASNFPAAAYFTGSDEYLTTDRFDIFYKDEYNRRAMWRGVPGFIYNKDANNNTRIVLPLDYFSLCAKFLHATMTYTHFTTARYLVHKTDSPNYLVYTATSGGSDIDYTEYESSIDDTFYDSINLGDILMVKDGPDVLYIKCVKKSRIANLSSQYLIDMRFIDWIGRPTDANRQGAHFLQGNKDVSDYSGSYITMEDPVSTDLNLYSYYGMNQAMNPTQNITPQTIRSRFIVMESRYATQYARYNTADAVQDLPHQNELFSYS